MNGSVPFHNHLIEFHMTNEKERWKRNNARKSDGKFGKMEEGINQIGELSNMKPILKTH